MRKLTPVLGIDLACRRWADIGSAQLDPLPDGGTRLVVPALAMPGGEPDPVVLADLVDPAAPVADPVVPVDSAADAAVATRSPYSLATRRRPT